VLASCFLELLWVSPELIPSTVIPGNPATQKGDVYSFAIILEEIVVRGGPFEAARQFLDPQGEQPEDVLTKATSSCYCTPLSICHQFNRRLSLKI
jgi:hypothetical protein